MPNDNATPTAADVFGLQPSQSALDVEIQELVSPRHSDDRLALRFGAECSDLRYVPRWGRWLRYDGTRWCQDELRTEFTRSRNICRAASAELADKEKALATRLASAATVAAVEKLARSDQRLVVSADRWDANPLLLNTPTGTVELNTGKLRAHDPNDHITKSTSAGPGGECPLWLRFLDRITDGDKALQAFLQRIGGYCLTGLTIDHALFFLYGVGANGKGVFTNTLVGLLGDYACVAMPGTFAERKYEEHSTELAMLQGARLVTDSETEEGKNWNEARVKQLTGGDPVTARRMRGDPFTYVPQFKLIVSGNNKPGLRSVDEAIRRRMNLVPFMVVIPEEERDHQLAEKLKAEYCGILAWAIDGCLAWRRDGLNPPEVVRTATTDYLNEQNALAHWIEACCAVGEQAWGKSEDLFASWRVWCDSSGHKPVGTQRALTDKLVKDERFEYHRPPKSRRGILGLTVTPEESA